MEQEHRYCSGGYARTPSISPNNLLAALHCPPRLHLFLFFSFISPSTTQPALIYTRQRHTHTTIDRFPSFAATVRVEARQSRAAALHTPPTAPAGKTETSRTGAGQNIDRYGRKPKGPLLRNKTPRHHSIRKDEVWKKVGPNDHLPLHGRLGLASEAYAPLQPPAQPSPRMGVFIHRLQGSEETDQGRCCGDGQDRRRGRSSRWATSLGRLPRP